MIKTVELQIKQINSYLYSPVGSPAVLHDEVLGRPADGQHQVVLPFRWFTTVRQSRAGILLLPIQIPNVVVISHFVPNYDRAVLEEDLLQGGQRRLFRFIFHRRLFNNLHHLSHLL